MKRYTYIDTRVDGPIFSCEAPNILDADRQLFNATGLVYQEEPTIFDE